MQRNKIQYDYDWKFTEREDPIEFVKRLFDSYYPYTKDSYGTPEEGNIEAVVGHYKGIKDLKLKEKFAKAVVQLMRDDDYKKLAIPAAAQLHLEEALPEFERLKLLGLDRLRRIKTADERNALYCLNDYANKFYTELNTHLMNVIDQSKDTFEITHALGIVSRSEPDLILNDLERFVRISFNDDEKEQNKIDSIVIILSGIFKKYGDNYCLALAKRFKNSLTPDVKLLYYKTISQFPTRFKPYLNELKTILEIIV